MCLHFGNFDQTGDQIFVTSHYAGEDLLVKLESGEVWKKVLGPVFIYLNSVPDRDDALSLWDDAKEKVRGLSRRLKSKQEIVYHCSKVIVTFLRS